MLQAFRNHISVNRGGRNAAAARVEVCLRRPDAGATLPQPNHSADPELPLPSLALRARA